MKLTAVILLLAALAIAQDKPDSMEFALDAGNSKVVPVTSPMAFTSKYQIEADGPVTVLMATKAELQTVKFELTWQTAGVACRFEKIKKMTAGCPHPFDYFVFIDHRHKVLGSLLAIAARSSAQAAKEAQTVNVKITELP